MSEDNIFQETETEICDKNLSDPEESCEKITEPQEEAKFPEPRLVIFSSSTENTKRFADKVGLPYDRIPLRRKDERLYVRKPYVLVVPTYGGGRMSPKWAIPKQVMEFLTDETNRSLCVGVISSGNTNFGEAYLIAGKMIAQKLKIPFLYGFELLGTPDDVKKVRDGIIENWETLVQGIRA